MIGVSLVKNCSPRSADLIAGMGERMNNYIIARYLESIGTPAVYIDAREIIKTDDNYGAANVLFDVSVPLIRSRIAAVKGIPVVTGFISSTVGGISTTLGRNGSDYTAGILGHALDASRIEIWTDVDGVMSADPRIVEKALVIPEISSFEAMELSYLGAQVIHPSTMAPALEKGIPIFIKNTMNPTAAGTKTYTYDTFGNVATETREDGKTASYTYNEQNKLTSATGYNGATVTYSYDGNGNMVTSTKPDGTAFVVAYSNIRRVHIYDDSGKLLHAVKLDYVPNDNLVDPNRRKTYWYIQNAVTTDKYIYLVNPEQQLPPPKNYSEIVVLDWEGNLKIRYRLNKFVVGIVVDEDRKAIIGCCNKSGKGSFFKLDILID